LRGVSNGRRRRADDDGVVVIPRELASGRAKRRSVRMTRMANASNSKRAPRPRVQMRGQPRQDWCISIIQLIAEVPQCALARSGLTGSVMEPPNSLDNSALTAEPAGLRVSLTAISPSGPAAQKRVGKSGTIDRSHLRSPLRGGSRRQENPEDLKQFRPCRRSFFLTGRRYVDPVI
jgi:hypothetical protein